MKIRTEKIAVYVKVFVTLSADPVLVKVGYLDLEFPTLPFSSYAIHRVKRPLKNKNKRRRARRVPPAAPARPRRARGLSR